MEKWERKRWLALPWAELGRSLWQISLCVFISNENCFWSWRLLNYEDDGCMSNNNVYYYCTRKVSVDRSCAVLGLICCYLFPNHETVKVRIRLMRTLSRYSIVFNRSTTSTNDEIFNESSFQIETEELTLTRQKNSDPITSDEQFIPSRNRATLRACHTLVTWKRTCVSNL